MAQNFVLCEKICFIWVTTFIFQTHAEARSYTKLLSLITLHQAIRGPELYTNVQNVCYTSVF